MRSTALFSSAIALAIAHPLQSQIDVQQLHHGLVLPVVFSQTIDAGKAHAGDPVRALLSVDVSLANGAVLRQGTEVLGRVTAADRFRYNKADYATQTPAVLTIEFLAIRSAGRSLPIHVTVRAIADSFATASARMPEDADLDPLATLVQIGGDRTIPTQREVRSAEGDVVGYRRKQGIFARLLAAKRGRFQCGATLREVPVAMFSASACGKYGFDGLDVTPAPSAITFTSTRRTPMLPKYSAALLQITDGL